MRATLSLLVTICVQLPAALTIPVKRGDLLKRQSETPDDGQLGCISMKRNAGEYFYVSDGSSDVCGMYMLGQPDTVLQIEYTQFTIECEAGGLMALVDGWELQSEFFPNIEDTGDSFEARYKTFCGVNSPAEVYVASQNVALIQFRVPEAGQGFRVRVSYLHNPQPCNVMLMPTAGVVTLKNYGERRNCTASIIYPENILMLSVDIGVTSRGATVATESGLSVRCHNEAGADYVEYLYGNGLDVSYMGRKRAFCGLRSKADRRSVTLGCQNSAVRLVSSGLYYNSITFSLSKPTAEEIAAFSPQC
ncbi:corticotropin-releasing factor-binding protein-like [Haliotis cracherodii]|uniref:corticotropin-releasing factor-binding protein-like n=1 Tax=Haliotis cracherodii TaxID=6455 RepID=UPI0039ECC2CA